MRHGAEETRQGVGADRIHCPTPALRFQRFLRRSGQYVAVQDVGGAKLAKILVRLGAARGCDHPVAEFREESDGDTAHTSARAGDDDFPTRQESLVLERHYGLHSGKTGRADGHRLPGSQARGYREQRTRQAFGPSCHSRPRRFRTDRNP